MRKGRYNILISNNVIKKYNIYMGDYGIIFIFFNKRYRSIIRHRRYKGGWLWKLKTAGDLDG